MTTNATAIRDAIFTRAQGLSAWVTKRKTDLPTLQANQLPALQVFLLSERMTPNGDANVSIPRFIAEATIGVSVVRGFGDPVVLDGAIDADVDAILDALLSDPSFVGMPPAGPGLFEGVTSITRRRLLPQQGETYFIELRLELTFQFHEEFEPRLPNWFEDIVLTAFPGSVTAEGLVVTLQVGTVNYTVSGPAGGAHGSASAPFTVAVETGASFTGDQSITISDGSAGGTFTPSIGPPGAGLVTVTPADTATSFTFTYTPASAGAKTLSFGDGQQWSDPAAIIYTAT